MILPKHSVTTININKSLEYSWSSLYIMDFLRIAHWSNKMAVRCVENTKHCVQEQMKHFISDYRNKYSNHIINYKSMLVVSLIYIMHSGNISVHLSYHICHSTTAPVLNNLHGLHSKDKFIHILQQTCESLVILWSIT